MHGFNQRIAKRQPIAAPSDVLRYFVTPQESGELCLMSCLLGENRDIFFPKLSDKLHLITFSEIANRYLAGLGYEVFECASEEEARGRAEELIQRRKWPCFFFESDTSGEKDFEEFYTEHEDLDMDRFLSLGVIRSKLDFDGKLLDEFERGVEVLLHKPVWSKDDIVDLFYKVLPEFRQMRKETGKYLDQRM